MERKNRIADRVKATRDKLGFGLSREIKQTRGRVDGLERSGLGSGTVTRLIFSGGGGGSGGGAGVGNHEILSAEHSDTTDEAIATGDVLYVDGTTWKRLPIGSNGQFLWIASGKPAWRTIVHADLALVTADQHHAQDHKSRHAGGADALFSIADYVFFPDAAPGVTVGAGDQQGPIHHSGPADETATKLYVDAETAPGASGLPVTIQYASADDLDTGGLSWTTIATLTLSSEKSANTTSMTNATIPANRLIRCNIGTIVGTPQDVTIRLRVKRPLST